MAAADPTISLQKAVEQVINKVEGWGLLTFKMLPNLVVAVIVLVIILKLRHPIARLIERTVLRVSGYRHIARLMATITRLTIIAVGVILALDVLNLDRAVASLLAGVGILGIAFGFASQDITANFMAGLVLHFEHPFRLGDLIKSGEFLGYVEAMNLRSTIVRNQQGQIITIPNKILLGTPITNFTIGGSRRVDLECGVSYEDNLEQAAELAVAALESLDLRDPERPVELFYEKFGDSSINFAIRFWTQPQQQVYLEARSQAIKAITRTFREHGITIPYPIRTLDFGILGGQSLRQQLLDLHPPPASPEEKPTGKGSGPGEKTGRTVTGSGKKEVD